MHTMHLLPGVAIHTNLELKTRPKQLLGSLPLVIALPAWPPWAMQHRYDCFYFLSCCLRWPRQVLSRVAITDSFAYKCRQCKWSVMLIIVAPFFQRTKIVL